VRVFALPSQPESDLADHRARLLSMESERGSSRKTGAEAQRNRRQESERESSRKTGAEAQRKQAAALIS
jgi:hypothetical protein